VIGKSGQTSLRLPHPNALPMGEGEKKKGEG